MAATTLRHDASGSASGIAAAVGVLALALGSGYALALGELSGLYVALSLGAGVAILLDFRLGAVLMLVMLPIASSALFPHRLGGISGVDPLTLLCLATVVAYGVAGRLRAPSPLVPGPLVWLYIAPIVAAGLLGMGHVSQIPSFFYEAPRTLTFDTGPEYLMNTVARPMVLVAVTLLIGAAAAQSQKPERFIVPIALSVWLIVLIQIGFVIVEGPSLAMLATSEERGFYTPIGLHANHLGRLHLYAFALLLFVWAETRRPGMKLFLMVTLGVLGIALLLTFSRAAIIGAVVVGALFLVWKFNARTLSLCLVLVTLAGVFGAEALYSRMTRGFGHGADAVSAGRIDGIWLPLLPEVLKSPLWGDGLRSTLWSFPMVNEAMLYVGHPHNAYLEALLDMGIIGLVLLMAFYLYVWKGFRALYKSERLNPELRGLFQGASAALVAFFVTNLVGSSLRPEVESSAYLWIAIGLMFGLRGLRRQT